MTITFGRYRDLLHLEKMRPLTELEIEDIHKFVVSQPTKCPRCGCQVFDPYVGKLVIHNVEFCTPARSIPGVRPPTNSMSHAAPYSRIQDQRPTALAPCAGCGGLHWAQIMARDVKRKLMVMPSNNSSAIVHFWAGKYEGRIGWLVGPSAMKKTKLRPWMPFALDNDAFASWTTGRPWDAAAWRAMLGNVRAQGLTPKWVLVPDVVADRDATLAKWEQYAPVAARYGWPLAIAVQDGMTPADIPANAEVIFIGGTTAWKWRSLPMWARTGARVHVGRVNEVERLHICERWRVESVDGTGWMQGTENGRQAKALGHWLEGKALPPRELGLAA